MFVSTSFQSRLYSSTADDIFAVCLLVHVLVVKVCASFSVCLTANSVTAHPSRFLQLATREVARRVHRSTWAAGYAYSSEPSCFDVARLCLIGRVDAGACGSDSDFPFLGHFPPHPVSRLTHVMPSEVGSAGRLLAHNRVFEEYAPSEPTVGQRFASCLAPYAKVRLRDMGFMRWLPHYTKSKFYGDISAACIIAVVLVPQGMAYAVLAGLDPVYGLYSSTLPLIVYSLITSSSQVAPGPVAPTAVLMEGMVQAISGAQPRTPEFTKWHITLAFTTGLFQVLLGALRFGWVADLLSWPVMSGFAR